MLLQTRALHPESFSPRFFLTPFYFDTGSGASLARHPWVGTLLNWVNPVAPFIEGLRAIIYGGGAPGAGRIIYALAAAAVALLGGGALFRRMQGELAVVL